MGMSKAFVATAICKHGALENPSIPELIAFINSFAGKGLWKVGACYEDLLDHRPVSDFYGPMFLLCGNVDVLEHKQGRIKLT